MIALFLKLLYYIVYYNVHQLGDLSYESEFVDCHSA